MAKFSPSLAYWLMKKRKQRQRTAATSSGVVNGYWNDARSWNDSASWRDA